MHRCCTGVPQSSKKASSRSAKVELSGKVFLGAAASDLSSLQPKSHSRLIRGPRPAACDPSCLHGAAASPWKRGPSPGRKRGLQELSPGTTELQPWPQESDVEAFMCSGAKTLDQS